MYSKESILKSQVRLSTFIDIHFEKLSNCYFSSHLVRDRDMSKVFGPQAIIKIPALDEVWREVTFFCEKNRRSSFLYELPKEGVPNSFLSLSKSKWQMKSDYKEIIKNLIALSKQVVTRVSTKRMNLLDEDKWCLSKLCPTENLFGAMMLKSAEIGGRQLKKEEPLTLDELKSLLSIATQLMEKGIVTQYYLQYRSPVSKSYP